ncbi:MAG: GEVED domain-containing protein [Bacteroidia bacterium]
MKHLVTLFLSCLLSVSAYAQYCIPAYSTGTTVGDSLSTIQLGTINATFPSPASGYANYTAVASTNLYTGAFYNLSVTGNPTFSITVEAWIDYNINNAFATTEKLGHLDLTAGATGVITFQVPTTATVGTTRLRVMGVYPSGIVSLDPCGTTYTFGETNDFTVVILPQPPEDAGVLGIVPFASSCNFGDQTIEASVYNFGSQTQDTIPMAYSVNGGTPVVDTLFASVAGGAGTTFTFSTQANLSTPSTTYVIKVWSALDGDFDAANDTSTLVYQSQYLYPIAYAEDFETGFIKNPNFGQPDVLGPGWKTTTPNPNDGWSVELDGVQNNSGTGPINDHTAGGDTYMYTETSFGFTGDTYILTSPCIDLTAATAPRLSYWYHMYGPGMGTLAVYVTTSGGFDSLVYGLSGPQQFAETDPWLEAIVDLGWAIDSTVQLRFVGVFGPSFQSNMAIDDISIYNASPIDVAAVSIVSPTDPACYGTSEAVTVRIQNVGTSPLNFATDNITITLNISGASSQTFSPTLTSGTLAVLATQDVVVTTNADLSNGGTHVLQAIASTPSDPNAFNDTTNGAVVALPVTTGLQESFETFVVGNPGTLDNGWTMASNNTSTFLGWTVEQDGVANSTGTGPIDDHTPGGSIYMYVETSGSLTSDVYSLFSPCVDLGGAPNPILTWWYHMFGATMGTLEVHVLWNGQDSLVWSLSGQQQTAETAPWLADTVDMSFWIGNTVQVEFRSTNNVSFTSDMAIDDILLFSPALVDAGATALTYPTETKCYSTSDSLKVEVSNFGVAAIDFSVNPMTVTVDVTGASTNTYTTTVNSGTLAFGGTVEVLVSNSADFSAPGFHNMKIYTSIGADPNVFNDSTDAVLQSVPTVTLPLVETFETFTPGVLFADPGVVANGWTRSSNNTNTGIGWFVETDGVQNNFGTGPLDDHTPGGSIYMYTHSAFPSVIGDTFNLVSPCIDFTTVSAPKMSFWYHMFGPNMGTLQVVVKTDVSETTIWSVSGQQQPNENAPWLEAVIDLTAFNSISNAQIIFRGIFDVAAFSSDMAIDDINIFQPPPQDAGVTDVFSPLAGCGLTANEDLILGLTNLGSDSILTNVTVNYQISLNGVPGAVNSVPSPQDTIAPGVTVPVTISAQDFSTPGTYTVVAWSSGLAGDANSANDTVIVDIVNVPIITSFPYFQDFESGDGGWQVEGTSTFELATPANAVINSAASGVNSWITNATGLYDNGEDGWVISPCLDFSTIVSPKLEVSVWWESEFSWDGAVVQSSIDNGVSWQNVGAFGDPDNWYTDNTINGAPGGQQEGWTGRNGTGTFGGSNGWVIAKHNLDGLAGQPEVRLRVAFGSDGSVQDDGFAFDDILIYGAIPQDAGITDLFAPVTACGLTASEDLILGIANLGADSILTNVTINYQINLNGVPGPVNSVASPLDTIAPGVTIPVLIPGQNFSVPGTYTIVAWPSGLAGDTNPINDTLSVDVISIPVVTSYPYVQNFENGNGGWVAEGTTTTFELATPAGAVINSAASGVNSWITNATGVYDNNEDGWVISPCFDFSALTAPKIEMSVWWNSEFSWDGAVLQSTIDNGTTWQNVGAFGDPDNWYNDNTINGAPGGQQVGWTGNGTTGSGGWVIAKHALDGLGGQSDVRLRVAFGSDGVVQFDGFAFDDVFIYDTPDDDMGVVAFTQPSANDCSSDSTVVEVMLVNFGLQTQQNIPVTVNVTGAANTTITGVYTDSIQSGDTALFVVGTFNTNVGGNFNFAGYTVLGGDTLFFNDSTLFVSAITTSALSPTVENDSICSSGSAAFTLVANTSSTNIFWYDSPGGSVIHIGDTLVTPPLTSSATYYAQATDQVSYSGFTPADNTFGAGAAYTFYPDGLTFDVIQDITIDSVRVYPGSAGTIVVNVLDNVGTVVATGTFPFGGTVTDTVLNLDFDIPAGTGYQMNANGSTVSSLFRNSGGAVFPYEVTGVVSVTGTINGLGTSGFYYFFYDWVVSSFGCPSPLVPVYAVFLPDVPVNLGPDGTACEGTTLNAFLPQIVSYQWSTGDTVPSITVTNSGTYYVDVVDFNGCVGTDSVILLVNPSPSVDLGPNDTVACDQIVLDAGNPGATYVWSVPGIFSQTLTVTDSGTYYVEVTSLGCSASDTITIDVKDAPVVDLGADVTSCNPVALDAGNAGLSFNWSTGDNSQSIVAIPPVSGSDTVSVTVTDPASGCATTDAIVITAGTPPSVDLGGDQTGCDSITLDAGNPGASYLWSNGATTQTITATAAGVYSVAVTDAGGCEGADTVTLSLELSPVAGFTYNWVNFGFTFQFNDASANGSTIFWDFGDGNTSTDPSPTHTYQFTGSFQVTQIITNSCGSDTLVQIVGPTSIGDELFGNAISIYPNPTENQFWLEGLDITAETLTIEVNDARGRTIMKQVENHVFGGFKYRFDLTQHAEGVYVVKISDGERTAYKRIVKNNI